MFYCRSLQYKPLSSFILTVGLDENELLQEMVENENSPGLAGSVATILTL